jgi:hypothetical protein
MVVLERRQLCWQRGLLRDHIQMHGAENLVYSILHTMDIGARKEDVIRMETFYKEAFGTRIHGLNKN